MCTYYNSAPCAEDLQLISLITAKVNVKESTTTTYIDNIEIPVKVSEYSRLTHDQVVLHPLAQCL